MESQQGILSRQWYEQICVFKDLCFNPQAAEGRQIGGGWMDVEESNWEACCCIQVRNDEDLTIVSRMETDPWLVWLSGLSASLQTKGLLVQFPVRPHAWVAGQVPSRVCERGNHTLMFLSFSFSFPSSLSKNK